MIDHTPKYWERVRLRAFDIQDKNKGIGGEDAYWLARDQIDKEIIAEDRQLRLQDTFYPGAKHEKT